MKTESPDRLAAGNIFFLERIQRIERAPALDRRIARRRSNANLQGLSFKNFIPYQHSLWG